MAAAKTIYLAGPEVFLPDALDVLKAKAALCVEFGFDPNPPSDNHVAARGPASPVELSREIFAANIALMKASDLGVFDLTPFRGPSADVGTVFELGLMSGLGKAVFAYTNVPQAYIERIAPRQHLGHAALGHWGDEDGWSIENFGNADNLMLDGAVAIGGGGSILRGSAPLPGRFHDLAAFRACLKRARDHFADPA